MPFDIGGKSVLVSGASSGIGAGVAAEAVLRPLQTDELVVYVPEYFADLAKGEAADPQGFLEGADAWLNEQQS